MHLPSLLFVDEDVDDIKRTIFTTPGRFTEEIFINSMSPSLSSKTTNYV